MGPLAPYARTVTRRLDLALLAVGVVATEPLLSHLAALHHRAALHIASVVVSALRARGGRSHPYLDDFPNGVPSTLHAWQRQAEQALGPDPDRAHLSVHALERRTWPEMLDPTGRLVAAGSTRWTGLHLGGRLEDEGHALVRTLASGPFAPEADDLALLTDLAAVVTDHPPSRAEVPTARARAALDAGRVRAGAAPALCTSVTDVLRLAVHHSHGDVSLRRATRFASVPRPLRRALLAELDRLVATTPTALEEVVERPERWKRLGEHLHPHEYAARWPHAARLFAVARGEVVVRTPAARAEAALAAPRRDVGAAARALRDRPDTLLQWADRLLRDAPAADADVLLELLTTAARSASGWAVLRLREHLEDIGHRWSTRLFVGRDGRPHLAPQDRRVPPVAVRARLAASLDAELFRRLPSPARLVVDPAVLSLGIPRPKRAGAPDPAVPPRGTREAVPEGAALRLYVRRRRPSPDAPLHVDLVGNRVSKRFEERLAFPSVAWSGHDPDDDVDVLVDGGVCDVVLGDQDGYVLAEIGVPEGNRLEADIELAVWLPADPRTPGSPRSPDCEVIPPSRRWVLRGPRPAAVPFVIVSDSLAGGWTLVWTHLRLRRLPETWRSLGDGRDPLFLVSALYNQHRLTVRHLVDMIAARAASMSVLTPDARTPLDGPITFIGTSRPDDLPDGSTVITPENLHRLIPD